MKINIKSKMLIIVGSIITLVLIVFMIVSLINPDRNNYDVIVVNKANYSESEFWEVAYAGMLEAAKDTNTNFTYMSAQYEYQIDEQKEVIKKAIDKKPDAIILVASDYYEIAPYAMDIANSDIKLILMDSDVDVSYEYKSTYIGTNSVKAGKSLGEKAKENTIGENKNAIILTHHKGVQTSDDRENGIKQGYGEENILQSYSCKSDEMIAYKITKDTILKDESIVNIFCTNENVTIGAAMAIDELGLQDRIDIYGFDGSTAHIKYLEKGILNYTVIQWPYQMGYLSIENAVAVINKTKVPKFIETDYLLIDANNMYDIGYREILFPFIK